MDTNFKKVELDSTFDELILAIDNLASAEEHFTELVSKTDNKELIEDSRKLVDKHRQIRQNIANSCKDILNLG